MSTRVARYNSRSVLVRAATATLVATSMVILATSTSVAAATGSETVRSLTHIRGHHTDVGGIKGPSQPTIVLPDGSHLGVDSTVTTASCVSATSPAHEFTSPRPVVNELGSSSGPVTGGTPVGIDGSGFTGATAVDFGSTPASFKVLSDTEITTTSPRESAGTVDVTVTTPGGTSAISSVDKFTYVPVPAVTAVSPGWGLTTGKTPVTITGVGLGGAEAVDFGNRAAVTFKVKSSSKIVATAPPGPAGTVNVVVTTAGGASATSAADHFTYLGVPHVAKVVPDAGPTTGKTHVTIIGLSFRGASAVRFGRKTAASFKVLSNTEIAAVSPAEGAGTIAISVVSPRGVSATSSHDRYTYARRPGISHINPSSGTTSGGTSVTITGSGLAGATAVTFGKESAKFKVISATNIRATSPADSAGTVRITVVTPGGRSPSSAGDRFTYESSHSKRRGPGAAVEHVPPSSRGFVEWWYLRPSRAAPR